MNLYIMVQKFITALLLLSIRYIQYKVVLTVYIVNLSAYTSPNERENLVPFLELALLSLHQLCNYTLMASGLSSVAVSRLVHGLTRLHLTPRAQANDQLS